jgi:hypothetical protein
LLPMRATALDRRPRACCATKRPSLSTRLAVLESGSLIGHGLSPSAYAADAADAPCYHRIRAHARAPCCAAGDADASTGGYRTAATESQERPTSPATSRARPLAIGVVLIPFAEEQVRGAREPAGRAMIRYERRGRWAGGLGRSITLGSLLDPCRASGRSLCFEQSRQLRAANGGDTMATGTVKWLAMRRGSGSLLPMISRRMCSFTIPRSSAGAIARSRRARGCPTRRGRRQGSEGRQRPAGLASPLVF